jgi:hypothetical protein
MMASSVANGEVAINLNKFCGSAQALALWMLVRNRKPFRDQQVN